MVVEVEAVLVIKAGEAEVREAKEANAIEDAKEVEAGATKEARVREAIEPTGEVAAARAEGTCFRETITKVMAKMEATINATVEAIKSGSAPTPDSSK